MMESQENVMTTVDALKSYVYFLKVSYVIEFFIVIACIVADSYAYTNYAIE